MPGSAKRVNFELALSQAITEAIQSAEDLEKLVVAVRSFAQEANNTFVFYEVRASADKTRVLAAVKGRVERFDPGGTV